MTLTKPPTTSPNSEPRPVYDWFNRGRVALYVVLMCVCVALGTVAYWHWQGYHAESTAHGVPDPNSLHERIR